jgi:hypothetical protein
MDKLMNVAPECSAADVWMDKIIHRKRKSVPGPSVAQARLEDEANPYLELEKYLRDPLISKAQCPEPIPWWGVSILVFISPPDAHKWSH